MMQERGVRARSDLAESRTVGGEASDGSATPSMDRMTP
jgi:hypothetical protein